jgi:vesicle coat complex subunit
MSDNVYEAGIALSSLASFLTPDLARDVANDLVTRLASAKPYVRKKATLITYKLFLSYPEALRPTFPRLKDRIEDPDAGVQAAAVNVICELARRNPQNYLSLAPVLFKVVLPCSAVTTVSQCADSDDLAKQLDAHQDPQAVCRAVSSGMSLRCDFSPFSCGCRSRAWPRS